MVRLGCAQSWLLLSVANIVHARVLRPRILRPRDTTYSANVRDTTLLASFGQVGETTTVNPGVTYFISGQGPHAFFGNIVNSGDIVVSQTDSLLGTGGLISTPLSVTYAGADTTNGVLVTNPGSLISLNDYGDVSIVSPSLYNWALYSMVNGGTMQWCGNGEAPTGSTFTLSCVTNTCINNGLIDWEQYNSDNGVAFTWTSGVSSTGTATSSFSPTNNGAFRLINTDLQLTQDVASTTTAGGCFVLGNNGLLSLLQTANASTAIMSSQSIYFTTSNSGLFISPTVYTLNKNLGAKLYGFGTGNYIAFTDALAIINVLTGAGPYSYSGSTLTVNFLEGTSVAINIGTGYTASSFSTTTEPDVLRIPQAVVAIVYNAAAPARTAPTVCDVTYPVCANPASTVTASFATTIGSTSTTSSSTPISTVFVTVTSTSVGLNAATTTTFPPAVVTGAATVTGTVEIITPASFVTVTSTSTGLDAAFTTTIPPAGTAPGTVEIVDPALFVTVTTTSIGIDAPFTTTIPPAGTQVGTVEIVEPATFVTTTTTSVGINAPFTTTILPIGTAPGTVEIVEPATFVTTTVTSAGIAAPFTTTFPPSGAAAGTVEIVEPAAFVTTTVTSTGIAAPFTTTIPPTGTAAGTVEIVEPAVFVTSTTISGTAAPFTTTIAPSGGAPGTVLIVDPATYVTITANSVGATAPVTYTVQPTGTDPGTVVVVAPTNTAYVTSTIPYTGTDIYTSAVTVSTAQPSGTDPGVVYVSIVDAILATVTLPYTGSATITTTLAATGGSQAVVVVLTPTISRPATISTTIGPNQCVCRPRATA